MSSYALMLSLRSMLHSHIYSAHVQTHGHSQVKGCSQNSCVTKSRGKVVQAEAEKRWEAALESPLAGVQFTYEEFADALSKYDFSFEVGDTVRFQR